VGDEISFTVGMGGMPPIPAVNEISGYYIVLHYII